MPLALGIGLGAQMQQPLAVAVIGGFVVGLPMLLMVFPSLLRLLYKNRIWSSFNQKYKLYVLHKTYKNEKDQFFKYSFTAVFSSASKAQEIKTDTINTLQECNSHQFKFKQLIILTVLIGYGVIGIESDGLKFINSGIKEEVNENIDRKITIDDFSIPTRCFCLWS